jgi:ornithine cyclodeaminase/alanine dehydrogenase-like protein (mu-crystallin family)
VAVDYDMQAGGVGREAPFLVDERSQFVATRLRARIAGYPDPNAALGEVLRGEAPGRALEPRGRILVTHLGTGLTDVVFAAAVLRRAERLGLGMLLPR